MKRDRTDEPALLTSFSLFFTFHNESQIMLFHQPSCEQQPYLRRQCGKTSPRYCVLLSTSSHLSTGFASFITFSFRSSTSASAVFGIRSRIISTPWCKRHWSITHANLVSLYANMRKYKPDYLSSK